MNLDNLKDELRKAKSGDKIVYHIGSIAFDRHVREVNGKPNKKAEAIAKGIDNIAKHFYRLSDVGLVTLVQKRKQPIKHEFRGPFIHEYIAVKN